MVFSDFYTNAPTLLSSLFVNTKPIYTCSYPVELSAVFSKRVMEKINLGYSTKNIPIPNERTYLMQLVEKIEAVIKRMRWKAIFFSEEESSETQPTRPQRYGLNSEKCPTQMKELVPFEDDLIQMVKNIKFRNVKNDFQKKLSEDIRKIQRSTKTVTPADKTSNMYRLTKEEYNKLLNDSITATYKKASAKKEERINTGGKKYAKDAKVADKMEVNAKKDAFITLKDHKENFANNPKTRLINPAKNEIGRISKVILDNINKELLAKLKLNQWKSTENAIDWFKKIERKHECKFVVFDIEQFYQSIKEETLLKALDFAKSKTKILKKDIDVIRHARRSLLFNKNVPWVKKEDENFDVTMGAYDGAEVCELIGIYIQALLSEKFEKEDFGLYRDDGLAIFRKTSGPQAERIKKDFQKIFKDNHLNITITCNLKIVNYLDITMNLNDGTYRPYHKPNDDITYIHSQSNHPPAIIKQLPLSIESRLRKISSSKEIFEDASKEYQDALERSGFKHKLKYEDSTTLPQRQKSGNRKRQVIWFNPPFSKSVTTNVGKEFLKLLDKHFPPHNKFRKIFNRRSVKVSYSCLPSMNSKINQHNKKILREPIISTEEEQSANTRICNCPEDIECPFNGTCLDTDVLYEAELTSSLRNYGKKYYKGICSTEWKVRYGNHKKAFRHEKYMKETELSKEVWRIKKKGGNFDIKWSKIGNHASYKPEIGKCNLCQQEKLAIALHDGNNLLNKRNEIVSRCRHRSKYKLENLIF